MALEREAQAPPAGPPRLNFANALTALRLVAVPVFLALLFAHGGHEPRWRWAAFGVFVLACLTDRLDGHLARKHDMVTELGKFADPIADKALIGSALVGLSILGDLWWWATAVILFRELGVTLLRVWALKDGVVAASLGGKIKTLLQAVAAGLYVAPLPPAWGPLRAVLMIAAVVVTVGTGFDYAWRIVRRSRASLPGLSRRQAGSGGREQQKGASQDG